MRTRTELESMQKELIGIIKNGYDSEEIRAKMLAVSFALQDLKGPGHRQPMKIKTKYLSIKFPEEIWGKASWECDKCKKQFTSYGYLKKHKIKSHAY